VLEGLELTEGRLHRITYDNASSNDSMIRELLSILEESGIKWPALRNHISFMSHVIQLAIRTFMSSHRVKVCTKSSEADVHNQQFGENESIDIGKSQRLQKEANARINKASAMRPGLAKVIERVRTSRYFESPEADLHIVENACCIDYADTWWSKQGH